jgi:DNA ligase-1
MKHTFPVLYAPNKQGVWKEWKISVEKTTDPISIVVHTEHGQHGGKMILDTQPITILKRGYPDLWEQAMATAQSKWNHKHEREGYQTTMNVNENERMIRPMLAKTFDKGKHLQFPLYIQPKIDGLRCLAQWKEGQVVLYSRTGCPFLGLDHVRQDLQTHLETNPNLVVDGELYSDKISFEELSGYCRRKKSIPTDQHVVYHVFDVVMPNKFHERRSFFPPETQHVRRVPTYEITTMDQVKENLMLFMEQGYEGIILRNRDGIYQDGHRSWDLQKYKLFQEEEFLITGYTEGTGREKGLVIWQCETPQGKQFHVRPKGDYEIRKKLFQEAEQAIGKKITVLFQEYTKDQVPRFPVAKAIRDNY